MNIYRDDPFPDSDDEPTHPSIPVAEDLERAPPLIGWCRSLLGFLLLEGGPS